MINGQRVVVVMPAYRAAATVQRTVMDLPKDVVDDIILVDDASHDSTAEVARSLGLHVIVHPVNRGYGGNQKTCYAAALERGAEIVVMVHPDYQYEPRLVAPIAAMIASGVYEMVLGSRIIGGGALSGGMPRWKYFANRALTAFENILLGAKLSEYHTGYRAYAKSVLNRIPIDRNSDDFIFDNELLAQAILSGVRIGEVSCPTKYFAEASSINFRRSCIYGIGVLRVSIQGFLARTGLRTANFLRF